MGYFSGPVFLSVTVIRAFDQSKYGSHMNYDYIIYTSMTTYYVINNYYLILIDFLHVRRTNISNGFEKMKR